MLEQNHLIPSLFSNNKLFTVSWNLLNTEREKQNNCSGQMVCGISVVYRHDPVHDWEKVSYHTLLAREKIKIQNLSAVFLFLFFLLNVYHFFAASYSQTILRTICLAYLYWRRRGLEVAAEHLFLNMHWETREIGVCAKLAKNLG